MAKKTKAQVQFEADTSGFTSEIKAMNSSMTTFKKQLQLNSAELKNNSNSVDLLTKRKKLLKEELSASASKVEALKSKLQSAKEIFGENSKEVQQLNNKLIDAQTAHQKIQNELDDTDKKLDQLENGLEDTGKATEKTGDGFTVFKGILADLGSKAIQSALSGLRDLASGLVDVGKQAMGNFAEFEQLEGGVKKLFGDDYKAVMDNASKGFQTAGMSANDYMETVTSFSASLIGSLDGDTKKATQISDTAIRDMADNANTFGTSISDIQNAYQGFAKGNYTMLDNLKLGYGGTKEEMLRLVKDAGVVSKSVESIDDVSFDQIIQAIHKTQEKMKITGTTANEASYTIEGSTTAMKSAWQNMLTGIADKNADFGQLANDFISTLVTKDGKGGVFGQIVPRITDVIKGISQTITTMLPKLIQTIVPIIQQNLPIIIQAVQSALQSIIQVLPQLVDAFTGLIPEIVTMIISLLPDLIDAGIKIIVSLLNGITQMLPEIITAIVEVIPKIIDALLDNLDAILQCGIDLLMALVEAIPIIIKKLVPEIPKIINSIVDALVKNIDILIDGAIQLFMAMLEAIPVICKELIKAGPDIIMAILKGLGKLGAKLGELFSKAWGVIKEVFAPVGNWFKDTFNKGKEKAQQAWSNAKDVFSKVWNNCKGAFSNVGGWFREQFNKGKENAKNAWSNAKSLFSNTWSGIKSAFSNVGSWFRDQFNKGKENAKNAWSNAKSIFTTVKNNVTSAFSNIGSWFKDKFTSAKNGVVNAWSNIKSKFSTVKNGIVNVFSDIKTRLTKPFTNAKNEISKVANTIKNLFKGNISMPKIKLPRFSISPSGWKIGDLLKGSIPKLSIKWNADGAIFAKPTLFDTRNGIQGVGEAGAEAVLPIEKLENWINSGFSRIVNNNYYNNEKIERLVEVAEEILAKPTDIYMDRYKVGQAMASTNDNISGQRVNFRSRGVLV